MYVSSFTQDSIRRLNLTEREIDVLACLTEYQSAKKIARILEISYRTVETHIFNITQKMGVNTRNDIIEQIKSADYYHNLCDLFAVLNGNIPSGKDSPEYSEKTPQHEKNNRFSWVFIFMLCFMGIVLTGFRSRGILERVYSHLCTVNVRTDFSIPSIQYYLPRPQLIDTISKKFNNTKNIQTVVILGMSGMGKTTLAREYALKQNLPVVWEVNSENQETILSSFEQLASAMATTHLEKQELEHIKTLDLSDYSKRLIPFVKRKLFLQKNWLLIFDNVDNFSTIQQFFPSDSKTWGQGHILITTRNSYIRDNHYIHSQNVIDIAALDKKEKTTLFKKVLQKNDFSVEKEQELEVFLEQLPPFPLDIAIAAQYLKNTGMTYDKYVKNLLSPGDSFEQTQTTVRKEITTYDKTRYRIITCTVENFLKTHPDSTDLLLFISTMGSQNIPKDLLILQKGTNTINQFISELSQASLLTYCSKSSSISIHRSTQQNIFKYLQCVSNKESLSTHFRKITQTLEGYCKSMIERYDLSRMRQVFYHLYAFLEKTKNIDPLSQARIESLLGNMYTELGDPMPAKGFLENSYNYLYRHYKNTSNIWLRTILTRLGILEKDLGNYAKAKEFFEKSIPLYDKELDKFELATTLRHASYAYRCLTEFDKAKQVIDTSIDLYHQLGEKGLPLALSFSELASFYSISSGDYKQAESYRRKSLAFTEKSCGSNHLKTVVVLVWLGTDLKYAGQYKESLQQLKRAYDICKKTFPDCLDHLHWCATSLGDTYRVLGSYKKAAPLLVEGVELAKQYFGPDHTHTDWSTVFLGQFYLETGEYLKAKELLEKGLRGHQRYFDENHYKIGWICHPLGLTYAYLGNYQKAQQYFEKSLEIYKKQYGINHPGYALILKDFGRLFCLMGRFEKAEELIMQALVVLQRENYPDCYRCFEYLGDLDVSRTNKTRAIKNFKKALQIAQQNFPKKSEHIDRIQKKIAGLTPSYKSIILSKWLSN